MAKVLIIDDDKEMCMMLSDLIRSVSHHAEYSYTLEQGLGRALTGEFDVVFLDVRMPDGSGLDIIGDILAISFPPEIIIMTGQGDSDGAELAIKSGAWDYLQKPLSPRKIIQPLNRVLQYRDGVRSIEKAPEILKKEGIIGESALISECLETVAKASKNNSNVMITGETGTGKELFARAIHSNSPRSGGEFVVVDCASLPESLVESALFGHEKGSFTGAERAEKGLVGLANGGSLFLDEVGEMNMNLQKVFLRVLQERKYRPIGSKREIRSDFRLVAATNRNLAAMVEDGLFREDLLYRLNAISLQLPPLRLRKEDIEPIARKQLSRIYAFQKVEPKTCSADFMNALKRYDWPGNVRELVNTLESVVSEAFYEPVLFSKHLPKHMRITMARSSVGFENDADEKLQGDTTASDSGEPALGEFREYREQVVSRAEKLYLRRLMKETRGNIKAACSVSGLGRTRLYTLMKKHGVDRMGW